MALPAPAGTVLYYKGAKDSAWSEFGCVTSINYRESTKTSETDLINNDSSEWSGVTVTSKTRSFEVSGLFKHTDTTGGTISGSLKAGTSAEAGNDGALSVGKAYNLRLALQTSNTETTYIRFTKDNKVVDTGNELLFVVTDRNVQFDGSNPVSYTITFAIEAGSLC